MGIVGAPPLLWRQGKGKVSEVFVSVRLNRTSDAVDFGIAVLHRFSGDGERVRYRDLRFCAAVQIGSASPLRVVVVTVSDRLW